METKITLQRLGYKKGKKYSSYPTYVGIPNGKVQPMVIIKSLNGTRSASFQNLRLLNGAVEPMDDVPEYLMQAVINEFDRLSGCDDD